MYSVRVIVKQQLVMLIQVYTYQLLRIIIRRRATDKCVSIVLLFQYLLGRIPYRRSGIFNSRSLLILFFVFGASLDKWEKALARLSFVKKSQFYGWSCYSSVMWSNGCLLFLFLQPHSAVYYIKRVSSCGPTEREKRWRKWGLERETRTQLVSTSSLLFSSTLSSVVVTD